MSQAGGSGAAPWPTNQNNSVNGAREGSSFDLPGDSEQLMALSARELPTPAERVAELHETFPERMRLVLTEQHDVLVRRDYCNERYAEWSGEGEAQLSDDGHEFEELSGQRLVERTPYTWGRAVSELLNNHERTRNTRIEMEKGQPDELSYETFEFDAETRWSASYQKGYFAEMKGWIREITGGQRPSGGESEALFDDPHVCLVTFSGSSVPDGERISPLDHCNRVRSSWSKCYDTLRNTMRALDCDWQYDRRAEPHTGKRDVSVDGVSANTCYTHDHLVLIVDGEVTPSDLRPIVEKHVEECDIAGPEAHDLDIDDWDANSDELGTVEIRDPEDTDDLAAYVSEYTSVEPSDLLERSAEFIAWAASVTAGNVKTITRSDAASWASTADKCKQQYESEIADQAVGHGESVVRSDRRGASIECACCGSPHGIDQDQTLSAARMTNAEVATDGGVTDDRAETLREMWPSARAAATVGESPERTRRRKEVREYLDRYPDASDSRVIGALGLPPDCRRLVREVRADVDCDDAKGFERAPSWSLRAVKIYGEEYPASAGNGVDMVPTRRPVARLLSETRLGEPGAEQTTWRVRGVNHGKNPERIARMLVHKHGIELPEAVDEMIEPIRGPLAPDSSGTDWDHIISGPPEWVFSEDYPQGTRPKLWFQPD